MKAGLALLAIVGAAALAGCEDYYGPPGPPPPPPSYHVQWCLAHHPGYDPRTNLFPGPGGRLYVCRRHPPTWYGPPGPPPPPPPGYPPPPPPPR